MKAVVYSHSQPGEGPRRGTSCGTSFEALVDNNFVCSARLGVIVEPCPTSKSCIRHHKEGGGSENLSELSPNQV